MADSKAVCFFCSALVFSDTFTIVGEGSILASSFGCPAELPLDGMPPGPLYFN